MCGIIGYTGCGDAIGKVKKGLSVLEYRGYDSVGIAAQQSGEVRVIKCRGRIGDLEKKSIDSLQGTCAIGHTRWATHGEPSDVNAHPHRVGKVTLVHNGIIENCRALAESLTDKGYSFFSKTDTEVAAALLDEQYRSLKDPLKALFAFAESLRGSFAFGILFEGIEGEIYALRRNSPLLIAQGEDGCYLASDMTALLPFTKRYCVLREGEVARLRADDVKIYNSVGECHAPVWSVSALSFDTVQKGNFSHYMYKEICEQPTAFSRAVGGRVCDGLPDFLSDGLEDVTLRETQRIQLVACGSAMHACLVGARFFESVSRIPTSVHIASEYRYYPPLAEKGTLMIILSQSGETADSLAALRYGKKLGLVTVAVVNVAQSSIAREADFCIYTHAGPEIAVATTKGYCTQAAVLYWLSLRLARVFARLPDASLRSMVSKAMTSVPPAIETAVHDQEEWIQYALSLLVPFEHVFFIGRGLDYALALEGALKLKEISYMHAQAYAAGELKHGTISLIEKGTPVIAIATDPAVADKIESNVREVISRGAEVLLLCTKETVSHFEKMERRVILPGENKIASFFAALTTLQLIAYRVALARGCDIDRPRNLAKSVTVE